MSLVADVNEFKAKCLITDKKLHSEYKNNNFLIHVHCLEEIWTLRKKRLLINLYRKLGLSFA